jgi:hypothetical protein
VSRVGVTVLVVVSYAGIALGGGCGGAGNDPFPVNEFSALHFTTEGLAGNPHPPDVDVDVTVTVTDASKIRTIYETTMELPALPPARTNCPSDPGVRYIADFLDVQKVVVEAVLNPAGCSDLSVGRLSLIVQNVTCTASVSLGPQSVMGGAWT